jgi:hypothetical protein
MTYGYVDVIPVSIVITVCMWEEVPGRAAVAADEWERALKKI